MREYACADMLDYGCGKGTLCSQIPGARGYDPAVPEFTDPPEAADLLVCTDVLEHIEPDCLDDVLEHTRTLTKKLSVFIVACRPANKTLPDGRNTHLIVEDQEWWLKRLMQYFDADAWKVFPQELFFVGRPLAARRPMSDKPIKTFSEYGTPAFAKKHTLFIPTEVGAEHIRASCARGLPEVAICEANEHTMSLCAYGPSLNDYLDDLRGETHVVTTSGAHDVLLNAGITPFAHMEADAHKHKATFMALAKPGIHYYLASRCHPDCFDNVLAKTNDVTIWHMNHAPEENAEVKKAYPQAIFVSGSASIASRAFCLGIVLGFRTFNIYAMDCSFPWDESLPFDQQRQHAGRHPNPQDVVRTDPIDGRVFYTTLQLLTTAHEFLRVLKRAAICDVSIRGTGLLATKARALNLKRIHTPDL